MSSSPPRPFKKILVANRGEIAARILSTCRELGLDTWSLYTENDFSHIYNSHHAVRLSSPAGYMSIDEIVAIVRREGVEAVHPGYGFLSESAEFVSRLYGVGVRVIGPGKAVLEKTGDKVMAKKLAESCGVQCLLGQEGGDVRSFVEKIGLPVMIKAVDGGGGRGIRLVRKMEELEGLVRRAVEESPSRKVFVEKAAIEGFRHVEVQILGDGEGGVRHLWERECSIQRRYQKIVELAPSMCPAGKRKVVGKVIEAAMRIAREVKYASLGTFEFLVNFETKEVFFLEINPRLQVEHTITESICSTDIVKAQLRLAQGAKLEELGLEGLGQDPLTPPGQFAIQLRVTAEDPEKNYSLSIGRIQSFNFPSGVGTRVDTALVPGAPAIISSDFDSVIAKIIITAGTWPDAVSKARRALEDTSVTGIQTNLPLLRAIVSHPDFAAGQCDTQWLESHHSELLSLSKTHPDARNPFHGLIQQQQQQTSSPSSSSSSGAPLFKKSDAWTLDLTPVPSSSSSKQETHHLQIQKILQSDFPTSLSAEITYTTPTSSSPQSYHLSLNSTQASASALSSAHPRGDKSNPRHIILPLSGKLVEVLVDVGDVVRKDEAVCVVKQMKMEVEIRSQRDGVVGWVTEAEDGEDVMEGMLVAVLEDEGGKAKL